MVSYFTDFSKYIKSILFWNIFVRHRGDPMNNLVPDHFRPIMRQIAADVNTCSWCKGSHGCDCICGMCYKCHSHSHKFTTIGKKWANFKSCSSTCELALCMGVVETTKEERYVLD